MKTWLNIFGGLMILGPLGIGFYNASKELGLPAGLQFVAVTSFAWLVLSGYTVLAVWLVLQ